LLWSIGDASGDALAQAPAQVVGKGLRALMNTGFLMFSI
jgi:hypothetical protein